MASFKWPPSGGGSGTITSVGLADGSSTPIYQITGSPVTTTGTLTFTLSTESANTVFAGPTTGSAAQPTFRALVAADVSFLFGNLTDAGTDGIVVTGGTGAVLGAGTSIAQHVADSTHNGYLSSADWSTFNGKQAAGNYITALTGDGTATGPGSVALTLATVNSNVGSFTPAAITVNGKGLVTAASSVTTGNLTDAGTDGIVITGGTGAVLGSGTSIAQHVADTTHSGYLSSTDWNTFNGKQATISIGAFDTTPNANGLTLSGAAISLAAADGTHPGGISTAAQTLAGVKTFSSAPIMSSLTATQVVGTSGTKALTTLDFSKVSSNNTLAQRNSVGDLFSNNFVSNFTTTATAAGTTTLVSGNSAQQYFTGSTTQTVLMPVASTLVLGYSYTIVNLSSAVVTVQSSGANTIQAMASNTQLVLTTISMAGTGTASWNWTYQSVQASAPLPFVAPTQQRFTSGTAATYTTPTSPRTPLYIRIRMVGGGAGGAGGGTATSGTPAGGNGGITNWIASGPTTLLAAAGGSGVGFGSGPGGAGGAATTIASPAFGTGMTGGWGGSAGFTGAASAAAIGPSGGNGGASYFGGGGYGGGANQAIAGTAGGAAGSGGGGGAVSGSASNSWGGGGGGAGGFIDAIIPSPAATYTYSVGAAGTAGNAATNGTAGGAGVAGYIEVTEYYQ